MAEHDILHEILDLARWAPSGDNTQPWRFEIVAADHVAVHGHDTRDWCLYDFDGHASHIAHGALLETLRVAATGFGRAARWTLRPGCPDTAPIYDVRLETVAGLAPDPLLNFIKTRTVQRRPMRTTPLTAAQRSALIRAPGLGFTVQLFESFPERLGVARLLWNSAHIRLTCPEAYRVHKEIIEWGVRYSLDRIPEQAVGVDPLTAKLMQWGLHSWQRVDFLNRYLLGTVAPRILLDFLPALGCAAHVLIRPVGELVAVGDYVGVGQALQRLWLTAAAEDLLLQPQMTPLIFRWYARHERSFSAQPGLDEAARRMAADFETLAAASARDDFGFFCRVGRAPQPLSRSLRLDLDHLTLK